MIRNDYEQKLLAVKAVFDLQCGETADERARGDVYKADLQRHKDALERVGEKVSEFEGHSFDCESNEVMDDLEAMFDSDGDYIWPIGEKSDESM